MAGLPISFKAASLAPGQSYDCISGCESTLKKIGTNRSWSNYELIPKPQLNKTLQKNSSMFYGIYCLHYNDVIMSLMASQITSLTIVSSTVYSRADKKKTSQLCVTGLCVGNSPVTGEFPAQRACYAENVSIWWCHHGEISIYSRRDRSYLAFL